MTRELQPCGTPAAYQRHLRRREDPCDACKAANRKRSSEAAREAYKGDFGTKKRAISRAFTRLSHRYSEEFEALLAEEIAAEAEGRR